MKKFATILLYSIIPIVLGFDYLQSNYEDVDMQWYVLFVSEQSIIFLLSVIILLISDNKFISALIVLLFSHELYQDIMDYSHKGIQMREVYMSFMVVEIIMILGLIFKIQINRTVKKWRKRFYTL